MSAMVRGRPGCPGFIRPLAEMITKWSWHVPPACARRSRPGLARQRRAGCVAVTGGSGA
jgi:hypothetical protein